MMRFRRTCPATGQYSVLLRAHDETVSVGQLQLSVQASGGDPCVDDSGATLRQNEGVISFIGNGGYEDDALVGSIPLLDYLRKWPVLSSSPHCDRPPCPCHLQCEWTIQCDVGYSHISLLFSRVETEEGYDEVAVFDGDHPSFETELSVMSGSLPPSTVETTGGTALIQFTSDESTPGVPHSGSALGLRVHLSDVSRYCEPFCAGLGFEVSFDCVR